MRAICDVCHESINATSKRIDDHRKELTTIELSCSDNPFATPRLSSVATEEDLGNRVTSFPVPLALSGLAPPRLRKHKSARLTAEEKDNYEKPWKTQKDPREKWEYIIFYASIVIGFAIGGLICYFAWTSVTNNEYCLVLEDNFQIIDKNVWGYEIQRGGFGSGSFEWTTDDPKNSYTDSQGLHIVPTLTLNTTQITLDQMMDNFVLNLTTDGTCTSFLGDINGCSIRSNKTAGTIINPVRSARLSTKGKKSIKYGKVEVVAKMPKGNWLWPAVWMMPESNSPDGSGVYGPWPRSGEIDIVESRGNYGDDYPDGRDSAISALHWGPLPEADGFWRTSGKHNLRRTDYAQEFHTYGLEWNEKYLFTYIDTRLLQVFFIKFDQGHKNMWQRGHFGESIINKSALADPWSQTGKANTPFDQPFYLILNVAIGATNGFFKDGNHGKPWGDQSLTAPKEFWDNSKSWLPTWGEGDTRGMTVKSVKMWEEGACGKKS